MPSKERRRTPPRPLPPHAALHRRRAASYTLFGRGEAQRSAAKAHLLGGGAAFQNWCSERRVQLKREPHAARPAGRTTRATCAKSTAHAREPARRRHIADGGGHQRHCASPARQRARTATHRRSPGRAVTTQRALVYPPAPGRRCTLAAAAWTLGPSAPRLLNLARTARGCGSNSVEGLTRRHWAASACADCAGCGAGRVPLALRNYTHRSIGGEERVRA